MSDETDNGETRKCVGCKEPITSGLLCKECARPPWDGGGFRC